MDKFLPQELCKHHHRLFKNKRLLLSVDSPFILPISNLMYVYIGMMHKKLRKPKGICLHNSYLKCVIILDADSCFCKIQVSSTFTERALTCAETTYKLNVNIRTQTLNRKLFTLIIRKVTELSKRLSWILMLTKYGSFIEPFFLLLLHTWKQLMSNSPIALISP